jgi:Xaa-Pro aminopeptidase
MTPDVLRARRAALGRKLGGEPILLVGHEASPRNFLLNVHPFRQDSTFLYYVGLSVPGAAAVIRGDRTTLYLPPVDPGDALWHGESPTLEQLAAQAGADEVLPRERLPPAAYHALPVAEPLANADAALLSDRELDPADPGHGASERLLSAVVDARLALDDGEVAAMRRAVAATAVAHVQAMKATRPGGNEDAIDALIRGVFAAHGMAPAYPPIVTVRGEVLHGHAQGLPLSSGDLLLVDAGAEAASGYASDVTRTWPVSGAFDPRQRAIYDLVLAANEASIARCRPGVRYRDVHLESARVLAQGLVDEGLLRGDVDGLVEAGAHAAFFPHGVGHLLGLDVHDMELYGDAVGYQAGRVRSDQFGLAYLRLDRDLAAGMVVTIEPGFYVVPAILGDAALRERLGDSVDWAKASEWLGFGGIRIEDDVLITDGDPDVLSAAIPKTADAIEAIVGTGPSPEERFGL